MTQLSDSKPRYSTETFDCLVELVRSIRPQWDVPGLRKAIRDALARADQPTLAELAYAVLRVAENFSVNSPAVIAMDGPHWRKAVPERVPPSAVRCPRCGSVDMPDEATRHRCKSRSERVASYVEQMRSALAESRRGDVMTPEESARVKASLDAPTDPDLCDCGHEGLGTGWHSNTCRAHNESARVPAESRRGEDEEDA